MACFSRVPNWLKLPGVPRILDFENDVFYLWRWDYALMGGSLAVLLLTKYRGNSVAIIDTGATAI